VQAGLLFVQGDGAGQVAIDPGGDGGHKASLTLAGLCGVGQCLGDEGAGVAGCVGRLGKHVQCGAAGLHDGAAVRRCAQDVHRARLAGDEAFHEVVERRRAGRIVQRGGVAQAVGGHAAWPWMSAR
jgi:hypothetical protein